VELELPAVPASVHRVRDVVRALAAGRVSGLGDVDLAVTEAATNVVVHAYRDRAAGGALACCIWRCALRTASCT
jgi:anti-sigma regulatory factor (Ser/Thr protein kinase)